MTDAPPRSRAEHGNTLGRCNGDSGGAMVVSAATTVDAYLKGLPEERRKVIAKVRGVVKKHLPKGYKEEMLWGMISYVIPLERYPNTYNKKPLTYVALAAQKNDFAFYFTGPFKGAGVDEEIKALFTAAGRARDIGRSCLHFGGIDEVPLDVLGGVVASMPVDRYIELYEKAKPPKKK